MSGTAPIQAAFAGLERCSPTERVKPLKDTWVRAEILKKVHPPTQPPRRVERPTEPGIPSPIAPPAGARAVGSFLTRLDEPGSSVETRSQVTVDSLTPSYRPPRAEEDTQRITLDRRSLPQTAAPSVRDRLTLSVLEGPSRGRVIPVGADGLTLGRSVDLSVRLEDRGLSRRHAKIQHKGGRWVIEDLGSKNGTLVGDRVIDGLVELRDGDRIGIGSETIIGVTFHDAAAQDLAVRNYESAVTDVLTRVHNRRYFDERIAGELSFALRHKATLALLVFDVDHFKAVNDTYGHAAGDAVLRIVSATVRRLVRTEDVVARIGGEEFAVLARGIDLRNALIFGERIRKAVSLAAVPWEGEQIRVTVSIGVSVVEKDPAVRDATSLIQRADAALYRAKESGRNRVLG